MKQAKIVRSKGIGALELIEEATFLLRRAPVQVLALYYLGTLPFLLGALYFWADMSRNVDAADRLAGASLGLALLFVWMKYWQARFCGGLSRLALDGSDSPTATDTLLAQVIFQPWGLLLLPLSLLVTLPFGWCFAFFQNIAVVGAEPGLSRLYGTARRQAALWPRQNHALLCIFLLLGLVVFANICIGAYFFPRALKTLFGIESHFTRSNLFLLNSTFWAAMAAGTHLCVDPLVKAAYLLRCHYGNSIASGADLLAELKEVRRSSGVGLAVLILVGALLIAGTTPALAAEAGAERATGKSADTRLAPAGENRVASLVPAGTPAQPQAVSAEKLASSIEQVIGGAEFAWRLPRAPQQDGEMPGFLRSVLDLVKEWASDAGDLIQRFLEWLADLLHKFQPEQEKASKGAGFPSYLFPVLYGLLALCLAVGVVFLWRQARRKPVALPESVPCQPVIEPDVSDENVLADELSQDRWSALAQELLAKGELRLGLRALYLASLACLAQERLIVIARFKSNRDYERELGRFGHVLPEVTTSFSSNVALFEQAWYGMHRLEQGTVANFMANYQRMVSHVRQG